MVATPEVAEKGLCHHTWDQCLSSKGKIRVSYKDKGLALRSKTFLPGSRPVKQYQKTPNPPLKLEIVDRQNSGDAGSLSSAEAFKLRNCNHRSLFFDDGRFRVAATICDHDAVTAMQSLKRTNELVQYDIS